MLKSRSPKKKSKKSPRKRSSINKFVALLEKSGKNKALMLKLRRSSRKKKSTKRVAMKRRTSSKRK